MPTFSNTIDYSAAQKNPMDYPVTISVDCIDVLYEQGCLKFRDKTELSFQQSPSVALMSFVREKGIRPGTPINGKRHLFFIQGQKEISAFLLMIEEICLEFKQKVLAALAVEQPRGLSPWW